MSEKIGKPAICYETGLDEAFLLGTREELSEFAHIILRLLDAPTKSIDYLGISTQSPIGKMILTHTMSGVVLDGLLIVKDKNDRQILMNKIRINNGDTAIDWQGFDELVSGK
jgi:hypothetical protein